MIDKDYIERRLQKLPGIEADLADPATIANQKKLRELVRQHAALKKLERKAQRYFELRDDISEHRELMGGDDTELKELAAAEMEDLEKALPQAEKDLMVALLPPDVDADRDAILEIRAGTGGNEAALFAGDLFRLYNRCAEQNGWKISLVDASTGEIGGYKEIIFSVEGKGAYGRLRYESGGHRVQRVPVTESQGRIHTSAATVAVFPKAEIEDDIVLSPDEVRVDIFRSSGPGGQSVNTTDSAVRVTHVPTGIVVQCQDEKSQHRNKEKAMSVLKSRILDRKRQEEQEQMGNKRRSLIGSGDRSERVRTYNFPQNRLTDHRVNLTLYSLDRIMDGDIEDLLQTLAAHDMEMRLEAELSDPKPGTQ